MSQHLTPPGLTPKDLRDGGDQERREGRGGGVRDRERRARDGDDAAGGDGVAVVVSGRD